MKRFLALALTIMMVLAFAGCNQTTPSQPEPSTPETSGPPMDTELVVYGSCEEPYLAAVCQNFEAMYGIKVSYQRLSTGEVYTKIKEENGAPSADVWFGGTTDPYNQAKNDGLLEAYDAANASHLRNPLFRDATGYWYGIYSGYLGFMVNTEELELLKLEAPKDWSDLSKPEYKGLVAFANPGTAGTGKLIINTMVQMMGEDAAMAYFKELDKNIVQYPRSGAGPSKMVGPGEIVIAVGFLHDGVTQILDGYDNIELISPASGTSYEIGATAIFKGAKHPEAAKLWIEYCLSPECVELGQKNGSYQFLCLDNASDPPEAAQFGLGNAKLIDYDFDAAARDTARLVELWNSTIQADDRLKTE